MNLKESKEAIGEFGVIKGKCKMRLYCNLKNTKNKRGKNPLKVLISIFDLFTFPFIFTACYLVLQLIYQ